MVSTSQVSLKLNNGQFARVDGTPVHFFFLTCADPMMGDRAMPSFKKPGLVDANNLKLGAPKSIA